MNRDTNVKETTACTIEDFGDLSTWGRQGWICPKCRNVLSPDMSYCIFCFKGDSTATGITWIDHIDCNPNSTGYHTREDKITLYN